MIGHRGASHDYPENTLEAFRGAAAQGADWVELDVRRTRDGLLVVHHDPHLSDGRTIAEMTSREIPDSVPSLAAALETCAPMGVNVEIKNTEGEPGHDATAGIAREVVKTIRATVKSVTDILISSFDLPTLDAARHADGDIATGFLVLSTEEPADAVALCVERGHQAANPYDLFVSAESVARAHQSGVAVNVWTVDDPGRIAQLASWGVDAVITNRPDVALGALGRPRSRGLDPVLGEGSCGEPEST
ncbi:MAG: glycerophosphodiester phosphodiesterase [Microthrixaceae bacterium]|nr:glycerophosphodiester phosphodiesterase [Microthrixaceae bacterium]HPB45513.1 glycerophosphodiester phosphodiesterase [Microthrixaceae bacterium]